MPTSSPNTCGTCSAFTPTPDSDFYPLAGQCARIPSDAQLGNRNEFDETAKIVQLEGGDEMGARMHVSREFGCILHTPGEPATT